MTHKGIGIIVCFISLLLSATLWYYTGWIIAVLLWSVSFVVLAFVLSSATKPEPEDPRLGRW